MSEFGVDKQPIYVFELEDTYLFKQYFEQNTVFDELQEYYNSDEYRFEVPTDEFPEVQDLLETHYYTPIFVDDLEEFCVVKEQYTTHAEILKNSVMNWSRRDHNFFIMKDPAAVDVALERGATRITDTDMVIGI